MERKTEKQRDREKDRKRERDPFLSLSGQTETGDKEMTRMSFLYSASGEIERESDERRVRGQERREGEEREGEGTGKEREEGRCACNQQPGSGTATKAAPQLTGCRATALPRIGVEPRDQNTSVSHLSLIHI